MVNEGAIYGHYMFYLKHEWPLMTHEWSRIKYYMFNYMGHLWTLYVLFLTRMTINDPWMTVNKNYMLNFRTFILIESWKGWMLRLPAFCWWASSPQKICSPTINPFGISPWQKEKQWKPVVRGKAILHDCMVFIVFFNFSTLSTKLTKNRFLLIIATVVIGESIGERSLFWKKLNFIWPFHYKPVILYRLYPKRNIN